MKKEGNKKKIIIIIACLFVGFITANVYAATKGYNNIFFMIRNLVKDDTTYAEKDEILIDRDITLSYSNIHLSDSILVQVNKLQIKDDEAKLFLLVTELTGENYISKVIVKDNANDKVLSDEVFATKATSDGEEVSYHKEIVLKGMTSSTKELTMEFMDKSNESFAKILVDIDKGEIDIVSGGLQKEKTEELEENENKASEQNEDTPSVEKTNTVKQNQKDTKNQVSTIEKEPEITRPQNSNAVNTIKENNTSSKYDISKVDNYASSLSWSDYWSPGLRLSYPTIFELKEEGGNMRGSSQGTIATVIEGLAVGINKETNTIIESNMKIEIYEPTIVNYSDETQINEYIYSVSGKRPLGAGFTNRLDDFWALASSSNDTLSDRTEDYFHTEPLSDGNSVIYRVRITSDNWENYKVTNIVNRFLGSLSPTSY